MIPHYAFAMWLTGKATRQFLSAGDILLYATIASIQRAGLDVGAALCKTSCREQRGEETPDI